MDDHESLAFEFEQMYMRIRRVYPRQRSAATSLLETIAYHRSRSRTYRPPIKGRSNAGS